MKERGMFLYELQQVHKIALGLRRVHPQPLRILGDAGWDIWHRIEWDRQCGNIKGKAVYHDDVRPDRPTAPASDFGIDIYIADALKDCVEEIYRLRNELKRATQEAKFYKSKAANHA